MGRKSMVTLVLTFFLGSAVWAAPITSAQDVPSAATGVTVIGYGEASAPAETATLLLSINETEYQGPQSVQPGATPGAEEREIVAPAVASLVDAGVAEDDIDVITGPSVANTAGFSGPAIAILRITLDAPTMEGLNGLIDAASVGAAEENLIVGGVGATYGVEDCDALDRQAREAAVADARDRADVQAELLEVTLGDVTGSNDLPTGYYGPGGGVNGCSPVSTFGFPFESFNYSSFDPTAEPVVEIYAQVQLSFSIE